MPPTTVPLAGRNLPAAGGGYFRLLPGAWTRAACARIEKSGRPLCFGALDDSEFFVLSAADFGGPPVGHRARWR